MSKPRPTSPPKARSGHANKMKSSGAGGGNRGRPKKMTPKSDDEEDEKPKKKAEVWICPRCNKPDTGSPMIGCDECDDWYHWMVRSTVHYMFVTFLNHFNCSASV